MRPATAPKGGRTVDTLDLYTAEKLVARKQAELRAASARESEVTEYMLSIRAIRAAARLVRRAATQVWNGSAKRAAMLGRASR